MGQKLYGCEIFILEKSIVLYVAGAYIIIQGLGKIMFHDFNLNVLYEFDENILVLLII